MDSLSERFGDGPQVSAQVCAPHFKSRRPGSGLKKRPLRSEKHKACALLSANRMRVRMIGTVH